jgi:hypothetical protein
MSRCLGTNKQYPISVKGTKLFLFSVLFISLRRIDHKYSFQHLPSRWLLESLNDFKYICVCVCVCVRVIHNVGRLWGSCPLFGRNTAQVAKQGIQAKISLKLEPANTKEHKFTFFKQAS